MEAGRELDALVAEKVMGWHLGEAEWCHGPMMHGGSFLQFWREADGTHAKRGATIFSGQWSPSTGIAAAWPILKKVRADGYDVCIQALDELDGDWWSVIIGEAMSEVNSIDRVPYAICLAALKAYGVEVPA